MCREKYHFILFEKSDFIEKKVAGKIIQFLNSYKKIYIVVFS